MVTKPHRQESWLREKYYDEGLSAIEMAEIAGVDPQSIYYNMDKFDMERDPSTYGDKRRVEYATLYTSKGRGHERWTSKHREGGDRVTDSLFVHQLLAISEGTDPHELFSGGNETQIHHKNGIPWDNRPENIEAVSSSEHARVHDLDSHGRRARYGHE